MKMVAISLLLISSTVFAENPCRINVVHAPKTNLGFEVGMDCPKVEIFGANKFEFVDGANGECAVIAGDGTDTLTISMDSSKEDTWVGDGCQVRATYIHGRSRMLYIHAVEN